MNLLIVESKGKVKTLAKALGADWKVIATGGHICDLPSRKDDPKQGKKAYWSHRRGELPKPPWVLSDSGRKAMDRIRAAVADGVERVYLASDPDREGERIAWHLATELTDVPTARVTFQEVTPTAVRNAVAQAHEVDQDLVNAALVRAFLDRLVGFRGSKMARSAIGRGAMGRVQTPTLGFVVERELLREAHVPVTYFEVRAVTDVVSLAARFHESDDPDRWVDENDRYDAQRTADEALATAVHGGVIAAGKVRVSQVVSRDRREKPRPPFSTDTLLQAAGSRWGWSPKKTMGLASQLYEGGHITYLRTDSTRLADVAVADARKTIASTWGDDHLGDGVVGKQSGPVQDAHEAVRPTRFDAVHVADVDADGQKLYGLIRARALASQMAPSMRRSLSVTATAHGVSTPLTGSVGWYTALGWRAAFLAIGDSYDTASVSVDEGTELSLSPGTDEVQNPELREGQTQPPPRYRPHTLIKAMKQAGIGRPSTYASTQGKLLEHRFLTDEDGLAPTDAGRSLWLEVAPLYELSDDRLVFSTDYTAEMEQALDDVAHGAADASATWEGFLEPFKAAHERARELKNSGGATQKQRARLAAMAPNADGAVPEDLSALTYDEAAELIAGLNGQGVESIASERQRGYVDRLLEKTQLSVSEAAAWAGLDPIEDVTTATQASKLIDALSKHPKASRPSDRQLRWIADLAKKAEITEADACAKVGCAGFHELTGGRGGTASQLIEMLKGKSRRGGADPSDK